MSSEGGSRLRDHGHRLRLTRRHPNRLRDRCRIRNCLRCRRWKENARRVRLSGMVLRGWGGRGGTSLAALLLAHEVDCARVLGGARLAPSLLVVRGHAVRGLLILALLAALADDVLRARVLLRAAVAPERRARVSGVGAGGGAGAHQRAFRSSGMPKFGRFFWQSSQRLLTTSMAPSCCRAQVPHQRRRRSEGSPKFARLTCAQNAAPGAQRQPAQRRAGCPLERSASFAKKEVRGGRGAGRGPCSPCSRR